MNLDDFVSATNLARYQRMLDESTDEAEREIIRRLVAEELAKQNPAPRPAPRNSTTVWSDPPT